MSTREIISLTALALSAEIRAKTISCTEVLRAYLRHIDKVNPGFNALVSLRDYEVLLAEALECDKELSKGIYRGWMHGFPHAVKDLADVKGLLTTKGSPVLKDNVAVKDSVFVERIRKAGAIIIGKTNVPEYGLGSHTYNPVFGATLNAYDGKSTAGGSSGGAAVGLALQMLPLADGSDFMGSLRNPAGFNNVIGFRPTPGRVPLDNMFIETLSCNGPMARNVSDTAMLLSTMAGYHPSSPNSLNEDPVQFTQSLQQDFNTSKIGWLGDCNGYLAMEEGVLDICKNALQGFRDIGCIVDEVTVDFSMEQLWEVWLVIRHWMVRSRALDLYRNQETRKLLKPEQIWEIEGGDNITGDQIFAASSARALWYEALQCAFQKYDFLVLPTAQVFPFDANIHWPQEIAGRTMDTYHRWMEVVVPGTLSGCPVINVPAGFSKNGLPMGLQIIGKRYSDLSTLQVAYSYEQATRWNLDMQPSVLTL